MQSLEDKDKKLALDMAKEGEPPEGTERGSREHDLSWSILYGIKEVDYNGVWEAKEKKDATVIKIGDGKGLNIEFSWRKNKVIKA